jgi:hypothetical protein
LAGDPDAGQTLRTGVCLNIRIEPQTQSVQITHEQ